MAASLQSILQGLSSVLAVAVVALLPAACESTGGVTREGVTVVTAPSFFDADAVVEEAGLAETEVCLDADVEQAQFNEPSASDLERLGRPNGQFGALALR